MTKTPEEREQAVRDFYASDAHWFDTAPTVKGLDWKIIEEWRAVTPEKTILDVGPHYPSDALRWGPHSKAYYCIDLLAEVIERGEKMTARIPQVWWGRMNATSLGDLWTEMFDTVLSMSSIDHIPRREDRVKAHAECARVLKPGGLLILMSSNRLYTERDHAAEVDAFGYEHWHYLHELIDEVAPSGLQILHYETGGHFSMPRVGSVWRKP